MRKFSLEDVRILREQVLSGIDDHFNELGDSFCPISSKKNLQKLSAIAENLAAEANAAYTLSDADGWSFRSIEHKVLWIIALSIVIEDKETKDKKWLRFLLSEKLPNQRSYEKIKLFLRTTDYRLFPKKWASDQSLASLLGSQPIFARNLRMLNIHRLKKPTPVQRPKGYTDKGSAPTFRQRQKKSINEEFLSDWEYRDILHNLEIDLAKREILDEVLDDLHKDKTPGDFSFIERDLS